MTETGVMINSEATLIGEHLADKYDSLYLNNQVKFQEG